MILGKTLGDVYPSSSCTNCRGSNEKLERYKIKLHQRVIDLYKCNICKTFFGFDYDFSRNRKINYNDAGLMMLNQNNLEDILEKGEIFDLNGNKVNIGDQIK
ncbi:MAG: hypothetical protein AABW56_03885 [Nanoarchaeota archaeon]